MLNSLLATTAWTPPGVAQVSLPQRVSSAPQRIRAARRRRGSRTFAMRGYSAAEDKSYIGDFNATSGSADFELQNAMGRVRNKVRALTRNSGTGKRYVQLLKDNIVGEAGFRLQVRVPRPSGGMNETLNQCVTDAWREFMEAPTVDGQMDGIELQKMIVGTWGRDGEIFLEIVDGSQYPDGFALNPMEGDLCDETLNTTYEKNGNLIKMGVEFDKHMRPIAYHFFNQHPGETTWFSPMTKRRYRRVLAEKVIHVFERLRPGQTRGEPPASSVVNTVRMLDGYRSAEVTGRRVKSATMGFVQDQMGADTSGDLDALATDEADNETDSGDDQIFELGLRPGTISKLPDGTEFKGFDPGGAQTDYAEFEGQIKSDISMGVGISPVSLGYETAKLSFSTHRGVVAEDRDMYRGLQSFFIRMGMRRVFAVFLQKHSLRSDCQIPPTKIPSILRYFKFMPRGWDYVDPGKEAKADLDQLQARTTSWTRIAAKRGLDMHELVQEIAADEELFRQYGLTVSFDGGNNPQNASDDDDDGNANANAA